MKSRKNIKIGDCCEDELVSELIKNLPNSAEVLVGPGDDCAVVKVPRDGALLLKADCVIEDVHFLRSHSPVAVGWKALCRPLSDVAAMGGKPSSALITIALPEDLELEYLRGIYKGLRKAALTYDVSLVGGETARSPKGIFVSVALTGIMGKNIVTRCGAMDGDCVFVTGKLGGSYVSGRHLRFLPRLSEAIWLVEHYSITAMMDVSDGLATDLPRLAKRSGVGFDLEEKKVPRNVGCSFYQAISDGEDYELLFTVQELVAEDLSREWKKQFPRLALTKIGKITKTEGIGFSTNGFQHFHKKDTTYKNC